MGNEREVENFAVALAGRSTWEERLNLAISTLCRLFAVKPDEVAIFAYDGEKETLNFLSPHQLRTAGSVPVTAHHSLVVRTFLGKKPHLDNTFATTQHVVIFEHFRNVTSGGIPIQKIMSVPMLHGDLVKGVVQVSRKGENREVAGADFSPEELATLSHLAASIAGYMM